tara:strand:+ start:702 stop:1472 length:771 start_codon:yes stop_codon:yes gene_type:complete
MAFALSEVKEKGYLRVAVYQNFAPFSFRDNGRLVGIEVELAKLLAQKLAVDPLIWPIIADETMDDDLRNSVWKGHYLGGGTADIMLHVPINKQFAKNNDMVLIDNPYFKEEIVVVRHNTRAVSPLFKLFEDAYIGVELDSIADFYLLGAMGGRYRENIVHYPTIRLAIKALQDGEVETVVAEKSQIESALAANLEEYLLSPLSMSAPYQSSWVVGMAVKRGRKELMIKLKDALKELKETGELTRLFNKYNLTFSAP